MFKQLTSWLASLTAIASSCPTQTTVAIPTHSTVYNGFSRGFSLVAPTNFTISQLQLPLNSFQVGDTASFLLQVNGTTQFHSVGGTNAIVTVPTVSVQTGDTLLVIGNWSAAVTGQFTAHNSYGMSAPFASSINGVPVTLDRGGWQFDIGDPNYVNATGFTGSIGSIGRVIMTIDPRAGALAQVVSQGSGCGGTADYSSFYELVSTMGMDLSGQRITGTATTTGFDITLAPGPGFAVPLGSSLLVGIGDDDTVDSTTVGGTLGMFIGSNGWMATAAGNTNHWAPTGASFSLNPAAAAYAWTDLQPNATGSGGIYYDEIGTVARVTYDNVFGWGTTAGNSIQITIDTADGDFTIEFGALSTANPENWLAGYSNGGPVVDPGSIDITAVAPLSLTQVTNVVLDLALNAIGRPVQGASNVAFEVTTSNIPASAISHLAILGLMAPPAPLDAVGMPGCFLNASIVSLDLQIGIGASGDYTWTAMTLPAGPMFFSGFEFNVQSVIFDTGANNFLGMGALTSNGLACTIGDV